MSNIEKYRQYFTKDYLMGPNSFRLLDELIHRKPLNARFHRTMDLGCGFALTSLFIANETDADYVYAYDLWIPATENYRRMHEMFAERDMAFADHRVIDRRTSATDAVKLVREIGVKIVIETKRKLRKLYGKVY